MKNTDQIYQEFSRSGIDGIAPYISDTCSKDDLINDLLTLHIERIDAIIDKIGKDVTTYEELYSLLTNYPVELSFCKQLFVHRDISELNLVFLYCINATKLVLLPLFREHYKLTDKDDLDAMWTIIAETWYMKFDVKNLSADTLKIISDEAAEIVAKLKRYE